MSLAAHDHANTTHAAGSGAAVPAGGAFLLDPVASQPILTPEQRSDEQIMFLQTARDFTEREVWPKADQIDSHGHEMMPDLIRRAAELGLCSVEIPEEYGGMDRDLTTALQVVEGTAINASWSTTLGAHTSIGTLPIVYFGNRAQKAKYLPKLATGELIGAYALSEAGSGSDALGAKTKAVLSADGKHYILNGSKMWISNAGFATTFVVFAKVDGDKFTGFIVDRDTPGFSFGAEERKMGQHGSSTRALIFEDAKVPVENVLGEIGKGHRIAFNMLNIGRLKLGAGAIAGSRRMLGVATEYALVRKQFGTAIANFGLIRAKLAEMASRIYVGEAMTYRATGMIDARCHKLERGKESYFPLAVQAIEEHSIEASILKVFGSEVADYVIDEAFQIHGGYGFTEEYPVARAYRDARVNRIYEGTNEINRLLIPGTILRRALKGSFPYMEAFQKVSEELANPNLLSKVGAGPLAAEVRAVELGKKATVFVLGTAAMTYGVDLEKHQQILGDLADMCIDVYGADSALTRALQANDAKHYGLARLFTWQATERVALAARRVLAATLTGDALKDALAKLRLLDGSMAINYEHLTEEVAAQVVESVGFPVH